MLTQTINNKQGKLLTLTVVVIIQICSQTFGLAVQSLVISIYYIHL